MDFVAQGMNKFDILLRHTLEPEVQAGCYVEGHQAKSESFYLAALNAHFKMT